MYPIGLLYKKINDSTLINFVKLPKGMIDAMGQGYTRWFICKFSSNSKMEMEEWSGYNPKYEELEKENFDSKKIFIC